MGLRCFGNRVDLCRPYIVKQKDPEILLGSANHVNFSHSFLWRAPCMNILKIQFVFRFPIASSTPQFSVINPLKDIKNIRYIENIKNSPPPPYQPPPKDLPKVSWSRLQLELTPIDCNEVECCQKITSCKNRRDTSQLFYLSRAYRVTDKHAVAINLTKIGIWWLQKWPQISWFWNSHAIVAEKY